MQGGSSAGGIANVHWKSHLIGWEGGGGVTATRLGEKEDSEGIKN